MPVTEAAPARSLEQRMAALEHANDIRSRRATLKRDLKRGERTALAVLRWPGDEVETMKVFDLLIAMPKVGRVKANKYLSRARISPSKTLGGMTGRQRAELCALIRGY